MPAKNEQPTQGKLLVAEPFLQDKFFKRSVVLLAEHNENGSFGFILNKPLDIKLNKAIKDFPKYTDAVYMGGPVNRNQLFYIHTLGDKIEESILIGDGIYWGGNFETVKKLVEKKQLTSAEFRFFVGYAGWDPEQLDKELEEKSWIVSVNRPQQLFTTEPGHLWSTILRGMGKEYAIMANFPEDPSLN